MLPSLSISFRCGKHVNRQHKYAMGEMDELSAMPSAASSSLRSLSASSPGGKECEAEMAWMTLRSNSFMASCEAKIQHIDE